MTLRPVMSLALIAVLPAVVLVATFFTARTLVSTVTTSSSTAAMHHPETETDEPNPQSLFDMYHIFDYPPEDASARDFLNWPRLAVLDGTTQQSWTERVPAGILVSRYVLEGTVQVKMANKVSSSGRFMGAGSLIDVTGPVTLTWACKDADDERVVLLSQPNGGEPPDKLVVAAGAVTVVLGALLARGLS